MILEKSSFLPFQPSPRTSPAMPPLPSFLLRKAYSALAHSAARSARLPSFPLSIVRVRCSRPASAHCAAHLGTVAHSAHACTHALSPFPIYDAGPTRQSAMSPSFPFLSFLHPRSFPFFAPAMAQAMHGKPLGHHARMEGIQNRRLPLPFHLPHPVWPIKHRADPLLLPFPLLTLMLSPPSAIHHSRASILDADDSRSSAVTRHNSRWP